ncbi:MAG: hypothetical protein DCC71_11045 [Proteobacteria bacterium]|nr:MAG: hypothetical protein DCC71_11045 [Pseudomonadota bacterium]
MPLALDEKIVALDAALGAARIPHAFGGALALAYYAAPRGTHDIDVNVFVSEKRGARVLSALERIGVASGGTEPLRAVRDRGQVRVRWEHTPIDLFFSYDPFHDRCAERTRRVPFGEGVTLPILSAEDLAVFKVLFDRPKDWVDLGEMVYALGPAFDGGYAREWLRKILEPDDARLARFEQILREPAR